MKTVAVIWIALATLPLVLYVGAFLAAMDVMRPEGAIPVAALACAAVSGLHDRCKSSLPPSARRWER